MDTISNNTSGGQPADLRSDDTKFWHAEIEKAVTRERERCVAEIRHVQKRNTATVEACDKGKPHTWNSAVETMAAECIDGINR